MKQPAVYILASARNGTLYVGVTSDLSLRMAQHDQGLIEGFTKRYDVKLLVYYEMHADMPKAIAREKQLKRWRRQWKLRLIEDMNPEWCNLFDAATGAIAFGPADESRSSSSEEIGR
jgi:putative endonuclease